MKKFEGYFRPMSIKGPTTAPTALTPGVVIRHGLYISLPPETMRALRAAAQSAEQLPADYAAAILVREIGGER